MATVTLGTNANNSLTALPFKPGLGSGMSAADIATINQLIIGGNRSSGRALIGGRFDSAGILYLPGEKGEIRMEPGDYIGVDNRGWPMVVRADSIASGAWTHT
jgi:hypothetical protein